MQTTHLLLTFKVDLYHLIGLCFSHFNFIHKFRLYLLLHTLHHGCRITLLRLSLPNAINRDNGQDH